MILDVAIVGASSAGLYAAAHLARAGRRVAIFEQQAELRPARRTLIITPRLQQVMGHVPPEAVLHTTPILALATPEGNVQVELRDPDLIVERSALTHHLVQQACQAGATLMLGHRFQGIAPHLDGAILHLRTTAGDPVSVIARAVIGADGVVSDVARAVGLPRPPGVPILQAEVQLPASWNPAVTQVWFDTTETRFFYWLIPESSERAVVGLVGNERADIRMCLQRFLARHNFTPLAYQGAWIAMYHPWLRPWTRVGHAPVLLVGDAAGHVKVTTVGGTVSGFWGASAAVQALLHAIPYPQALRPLKRELDLHWLIRLLLERLDNAGYQRLLQTLNLPAQQFLGRYNRDEMAAHFWQLLLLQPRLLEVGLRALLGRWGQAGPRLYNQTGPMEHQSLKVPE